MKDFPLRAWVLNGSQEYKIKQTKVHGDVRAVNVTLQGENKVHLLFTVLSTDQRSNFDFSLISYKFCLKIHHLDTLVSTNTIYLRFLLQILEGTIRQNYGL